MRRRDFLKTLPIGFAATCLPFGGRNARASAILQSPMLSALTNSSAQTDRVAVVIWLDGGNDGLNTVIPFEDPLYDLNRKLTGFSQKADKAMLVDKVRVDLALNPAMKSVVPLWKEGKMAVVQNVGLPNADLSHFRATDIWNSASDADVLVPTGWVARWLELDHSDYPNTLPEDPLAISMGGYSSPIFHGTKGQMDIMVENPVGYRSSSVALGSFIPPTYGGKQLKFVDDLISISDKYSKRFQDLFPVTPKNKVAYPDTLFGHDLQQIAWCINAGLSTKIYFATKGGFDTHAGENTKDPTVDGQALNLKIVFDAIAAFQADMEASGLADQVIVMTYSEFGRRISENGAYNSGTDHGTCAPQFLFGTNVQGELYGSHPNLKDMDANGNPINEFEFRSVYASVLGDWFGVSRETVQSILSPGKAHSPFYMEFPVNGSAISQPLIKISASKVNAAPVTKNILSGDRCFPNPFATNTTLAFQLNQSALVTIEFFDSKGNLLQKMSPGFLRMGEHQVPFRANGLSSQTIYYRIVAANSQRTGAMQLLR